MEHMLGAGWSWDGDGWGSGKMEWQAVCSPVPSPEVEATYGR